VGFLAEVPPKTASVVWDLDHEWNDEEWMATRDGRQSHDAPMAIYELHMGSWRKGESGDSYSYREMAEPLANAADVESVIINRRAGLMHLLAVSGLHLGIFLAGLWFLLRSFGLRPRIAYPLVGIAVLFVLWIVGLVNSFNMLDNMDGLSAGVAAIAAAIKALEVFRSIHRVGVDEDDRVSG